jgi:hypothetical protein
MAAAGANVFPRPASRVPYRHPSAAAHDLRRSSVRGVVRRIVRSTHGRWLALTGSFLLQGCPQLLDDDFLPGPAPSNSGSAPCVGEGCGVESPGLPGPPDAGGPPALPPPPPPPPGGDAGPDAGATDVPSCWTVPLNDSTHIATNNCLDIFGWNSAVVDEDDGSTSVTRSYSDGKVCLSGQLDDEGWGMVYNFTFADDAAWNASTRGVSGMELEVSGPNPPTRVEVIYTVNGNQDFCRAVEPFVTTIVPFAETHPDCSTNAGAATPDVTALTHLRLHFPVGTATRPYDFCLELRGAR